MKDRPPRMTTPLFYGVRQAMNAFEPPLGDAAYLYAAIREGKLKVHCIGLRQYITADELTAWVKTRGPRIFRRKQKDPDHG